MPTDLATALAKAVNVIEWQHRQLIEAQDREVRLCQQIVELRAARNDGVTDADA